MSPINPHAIALAGVYLRCPDCRCPWTEPVPPRWLLTVKGVMAEARITPHLPTCSALKRVRDGGGTDG